MKLHLIDFNGNCSEIEGELQGNEVVISKNLKRMPLDGKWYVIRANKEDAYTWYLKEQEKALRKAEMLLESKRRQYMRELARVGRELMAIE